MKTIYLFISFVLSISFAGIGIEDYNTGAILLGLFFAVVTVLLVFLHAKHDILNAKNIEHAPRPDSSKTRIETQSAHDFLNTLKVSQTRFQQNKD
jgi:hypothetical protein